MKKIFFFVRNFDLLRLSTSFLNGFIKAISDDGVPGRKMPICLL